MTNKRYENGYKGGCHTCESVGIKNLKLLSSLLEIMLIAAKNGEDCSYIAAKQALEEEEKRDGNT